MEFKQNTGWVNMGKLPEIKQSLGLASIKVATSEKTGKTFGLFVQADGSYLTTKVDKNVDPKALEDAYLWRLGENEFMIGVAEYENKGANILGEI